MFILKNNIKRLVSLIMAIMILFTSTGGLLTISALLVSEEIEPPIEEEITLSMSLDSLQSAGRNIERFTVEFAERKIQEKSDEPITDTTTIKKYDTSNIAKEALKHIGSGGGKFWGWYGATAGTPWCAIFAYYCLTQSNYTIDKSASVVGLANYYKSKNMYIDDNDYIPKAGDLIFYSFNGYRNGLTHVGIVEKYENGMVYTVEGNWNGNGSNYASKVCKECRNVNDKQISGYGLND